MECPICGRRFPSSRDLNFHANICVESSFRKTGNVIDHSVGSAVPVSSSNNYNQSSVAVSGNVGGHFENTHSNIYHQAKTNAKSSTLKPPQTGPASAIFPAPSKSVVTTASTKGFVSHQLNASTSRSNTGTSVLAREVNAASVSASRKFAQPLPSSSSHHGGDNVINLNSSNRAHSRDSLFDLTDETHLSPVRKQKTDSNSFMSRMLSFDLSSFSQPQGMVHKSSPEGSLLSKRKRQSVSNFKVKEYSMLEIAIGGKVNWSNDVLNLMAEINSSSSSKEEKSSFEQESNHENLDEDEYGEEFPFDSFTKTKSENIQLDTRSDQQHSFIFDAYKKFIDFQSNQSMNPEKNKKEEISQISQEQPAKLPSEIKEPPTISIPILSPPPAPIVKPKITEAPPSTVHTKPPEHSPPPVLSKSAPLSVQNTVINKYDNCGHGIAVRDCQVRDNILIDGSNALQKLPVGTTIFFFEKGLLKSTEDDIVDVVRLHIKAYRLPSTLASPQPIVDLDGWVSLTGRLINDTNPMVNITKDIPAAPRVTKVQTPEPNKPLPVPPMQRKATSLAASTLPVHNVIAPAPKPPVQEAMKPTLLNASRTLPAANVSSMQKPTTLGSLNKPQQSIASQPISSGFIARNPPPNTAIPTTSASYNSATRLSPSSSTYPVPPPSSYNAPSRPASNKVSVCPMCDFRFPSDWSDNRVGDHVKACLESSSAEIFG